MEDDKPATLVTVPRGTIAYTGHPANRRWVVKGHDGWRQIDTGELCDEDEFRGGWGIVSLPRAHLSR